MTRLRLSEQRRSEIFDATIDVLLDDGYENATIEAIAQRAGASKATLYRHWTDKPTLVLLVAARARSGIDLDQISSTALRSDLAELVRMLSAHGERNIGRVLVLAHAARHDRGLAHSIEVVLQPLRSALSALLAAAVERGRNDRPKGAVRPRTSCSAPCSHPC
ncbi:TetR/AcrR family transcriptional regulator [Bacillus mobilis]|uniref:TetR/AcrR family transcriptional regulator n=2 Tax=Bacillati TaxID=1783272 RepID=UPI003637E0D8